MPVVQDINSISLGIFHVWRGFHIFTEKNPLGSEKINFNISGKKMIIGLNNLLKVAWRKMSEILPWQYLSTTLLNEQHTGNINMKLSI